MSILFGKKQKKGFDIKFMSYRKLFLLISLTVFTIGIIFNILNGTGLDIKFTGGAIFRYSLTRTVSDSDLDSQECADAISVALGKPVRVSINTKMDDSGGVEESFVVTLAENSSVGHNADSVIRRSVKAIFPGNELTLKESNSVDSSESKVFATECFIAVALAFSLMLLYISFRFKKTGGLLLAFCGLCAVMHDCLIVYFAFVVMRFTLDDTFIAAVLATMGYSLNSSIVVFDHVRENKRLLGEKAPLERIIDKSLNETVTRNLSTAFCMAIAVSITSIVAFSYELDVIVSFTATLLFGVVSASYSSLCITMSLFYSFAELKRILAERKLGKSLS